MAEQELRIALLEIMEESLGAQLRAVRRLRKGEKDEDEHRSEVRMSQVDMAYDILKRARGPLHVNVLLERVYESFGVRVDRESIVSSLTKKVARGDRFVRTGKNTFGLKE